MHGTRLHGVGLDLLITAEIDSATGKITSVEVSTDGGRNWTEAELQPPILSKATVRFRHLWNWDGNETIILSRAIDETGYVQPTVQQLWEARGQRTRYHMNNQRAWKIAADGSVTFGFNASQGEAIGNSGPLDADQLFDGVFLGL